MTTACRFDSVAARSPAPGIGCAVPGDAELLRQYSTTRAQAAFDAIVRRHRPMVFRTCYRLLRNSHSAEDATQGVFLVLAQRPEMVRRSLVGCLHELARGAAAEIRRAQTRRRQREEMVARMNAIFDRWRQNRTSTAERHELYEELDRALAQLPDALRQAVILRYLEGRSQEQAAQVAGCPTGTLGWRAAKGLERLRTILAARGAVLPTAALAASLTGEANAAALTSSPALAAVSGETASRAAQDVAAALLASQPVRKLTLAAAALVFLGLGASTLALSAPTPEPPAALLPAPVVVQPVAMTPAPLGIFSGSLDIGKPGKAGSAALRDGAYIVQGGGATIYGKNDQFRFVYRTLAGDGEIRARVASICDRAPTALAGVMVRDSLDADSLHTGVFVSPTGEWMCKFRTREHPGSGCVSGKTAGNGKHWVRLVRRGRTLTGYTRADAAADWKQTTQQTIALERTVHVGLAVTAHDNGRIARVCFDHVTVETKGN